MGIDDLSPSQRRALATIARLPNKQWNAGGHGMAPTLSSLRSLVRKGILSEYRTASFALRKEFTELAEACVEWRKRG
jgi:hypothetical protein